MKTLLAILLLGSSLVAVAQPANPIRFATEIGQVATKNAKVSIEVAGTVAEGGATIEIVFENEDTLGGKNALPLDALPRLLDLIEAPKKEADYVGDICSVKGNAGGGKDIVFEVKGFSLTRRDLSFDQDNTELLAKVLRRAEEAAKWMKPRLEPLAEK